MLQPVFTFLCILWIVAFIQFSILVSPLPPSCLETLNMPVSSLRCKVLCIVICFLDLWSLSLWISFLSILRMVQSIFQGRLLTCLFLWWDFCCKPWFWEVFSFFWDTLFFFFFFNFISVFIMLFASNTPNNL